MCPSPKSASARSDPPADLVSTCFSCTRLNASTFRIVEDDKWSEIPFIYAKIFKDVIVLLDTGCGGASRNEEVTLKSLRTFLETFDVFENDNKPLNKNGEKCYLVVCSHCHFDHIGGIAEFSNLASTQIWASSYDKTFIEGEGQLPTTSLCLFFGMETPSYTVTHWASDGQKLFHDGLDLGLQIFHTPGHTPDELALWDQTERVLFVGDTMYEWAHIVFPKEGSLIDYSSTIGKLKTLVRHWNSNSALPSVKIACGHNTDGADGEDLLREVDKTLYHCINRWIEPSGTTTFRGELILSFEREDGRLSFSGPRRLFNDFQLDLPAMEAITNRQSFVALDATKDVKAGGEGKFVKSHALSETQEAEMETGAHDGGEHTANGLGLWAG